LPERMCERFWTLPTEPRRLGLARRILQARDGRLRRQRRSGLRTALDRDLHQRIVPQTVEVDRVLVPAGASKSTVRFLRQTASRSKGSGVSEPVAAIWTVR
jgi:hypothetical protein